MEDLTLVKKTLKLYLICVVCFSIVLEAVYIATSGITPILILVLMWVPGATAIFISKKYFKKQNILGLRKSKFRYIAASILIPAAYLLISYGICWICLRDSYSGIDVLTGPIKQAYGTDLPDFIILIIIIVIGFIFSCASAAGEEIGWRGFMYPAMENVWDRKRALLISGIIWALWHMPLIISGLYQSKTALWYGLIMFTIEIVGISIILSWLRTVSNSIWPAVFLHAAHNIFDQAVFQIITSHKYSAYFAGEQGFVTIIIVVLIALTGIILWKRKEQG